MAGIQSVKKVLKLVQTENEELYCFLSLVFYCGMEKQEGCFAKAGNVTQKKDYFLIETTSKRKKTIVKIEGKVYTIFKKYLSGIQKLKSKGNDLPLFPKYHGEKAKRTISRHLGKYSLAAIHNQIRIHEIRTAGIKMYYEELMQTLSNKDEALKKVGERFRISTDEVEAQRTGKVKLAGKQKNIYENAETIWDIIEELNKIKAQAKLAEIDKLTIEFHARLEKDGYKDDKKNQLIRLWEEKIKKP